MPETFSAQSAQKYMGSSPVCVTLAECLRSHWCAVLGHVSVCDTSINLKAGNGLAVSLCKVFTTVP